jgi:phosphoribosylformylglycinamidine synthase
VGKHITLRLEAASQQEAEKMAEEACRKLLANAIMEGYRFTVSHD